MDNKVKIIDQIQLSETQKRAQRHRAKGLALALFLFVLVIFAGTMAHLYGA
ncbi:hypothetical protein [Bartonella tamiae]|uniref:hypothetical protein n=1 Tax=Bartonella tamiae TaxID=373638 RepID=UPI0002F95417|nr:hypothetical protein [Bartonella tamiae]